MKRVRLTVVAAFALLFVAFAAPANAQRGVWLAAAGTPPIGDSKDALKTGWLLDFGYSHPLGASKVSLQAGGLYGSNSAKVGDGSMTLFGGLINLIYGTGIKPKWSWYVYGGGGALSLKPDQGDSETKGAFHVGTGLSRELNAKHDLWFEARYLSSGSGNEKLTLMPITVGISHLLGPRPQ